MKYICDGRECEYAKDCCCNLFDVTMIEDAINEVKRYIRGINEEGEVCKCDLSSDL